MGYRAVDVPGYERLRRVLERAYEQSATGKGKERHANDKSFDRQPIMEIARMVGVGFNTGQVMKKVQEATGMAGRGEYERAQAELLGAIVYAAAAYELLEEYIDARMLDKVGQDVGEAATASLGSADLARNLLPPHLRDKVLGHEQHMNEIRQAKRDYFDGPAEGSANAK